MYFSQSEILNQLNKFLCHTTDLLVYMANLKLIRRGKQILTFFKNEIF